MYVYNPELNKQRLDDFLKECHIYKNLIKRFEKVINKYSESLINNLSESPLLRLYCEYSSIDKILKKLDEMLKRSNSIKWVDELLKPNKTNGCARFCELDTAFHIMYKNKIKDLIFQPSNQGKQMPDIRLILSNNKEVYLEVTALIEGRGTYEETLYNTCKEMSKYLGNKLRDKNINCSVLSVACDEKIICDNNINDYINITKCFIDRFEFVELIDKLLQIRDSITLEFRQYKIISKDPSNLCPISSSPPDKQVNKEIQKHWEKYNKKYSIYYYDDKYRAYKIKDHNDIIFKIRSYMPFMLIWRKTQLPRVITSISMMMTGRQGSFYDWDNSIIEARGDKIISKLEEKLLNKKQLQLNKPNILVIVVNEPFLYHKRTEKKVKQWLCENKDKIQMLSGILIKYVGDWSNGNIKSIDIYISNQYASNESKLDKSELDEIGIKAT